MPELVLPAALDDVAEIAALEAASFELDPWSAGLIEEGVAGRLPTVSYLVARSTPEGEVGGYAVLSVVGEDAELQRIAVADAWRRAGVATCLVREVVVRAQADGATRLLLEVSETNTAARALYARHGFEELGRRPRYYRDGATALVLSRPLDRGVTMEAW